MNIKDILDLKETQYLTEKAKFLYKNGLYEDSQTLTEYEVSEDMHDVTYGAGFLGFDVYEKETGELILVKTTAEEGNVYNYVVVNLGAISDEDFAEAYEYAESIKKFTISKIFKWTTLVICALCTISILITIGTFIAVVASDSSYTFIDILTGLLDYFMSFGVLVAATAIVYRKK